MKTLNDCLIELGKATAAFSVMNKSLYAPDDVILVTNEAFTRLLVAKGAVLNHPEFALELLERKAVG